MATRGHGSWCGAVNCKKHKRIKKWLSPFPKARSAATSDAANQLFYLAWLHFWACFSTELDILSIWDGKHLREERSPGPGKCRINDVSGTTLCPKNKKTNRRKKRKEERKKERNEERAEVAKDNKQWFIQPTRLLFYVSPDQDFFFS